MHPPTRAPTCAPTLRDPSTHEQPTSHPHPCIFEADHIRSDVSCAYPPAPRCTPTPGRRRSGSTRAWRSFTRSDSRTRRACRWRSSGEGEQAGWGGEGPDGEGAEGVVVVRGVAGSWRSRPWLLLPPASGQGRNGRAGPGRAGVCGGRWLGGDSAPCWVRERRCQLPESPQEATGPPARRAAAGARLAEAIDPAGGGLPPHTRRAAGGK